MKERPILFQGDMVRALLAGTKTQTRRPVKPFPYLHLGRDGVEKWHWRPRLGMLLHPGTAEMAALSPYGQPGDRLWVRESFWGCDLPGFGDQPCVVYNNEWHGKEYTPAAARPWARKFGRIPSIHMPRDCSRILLEITDVRVERLQDISEADAAAEGYPGYQVVGVSARAWYAALWETINGAGSWAANPWVWAVSFKVVTP